MTKPQQNPWDVSGFAYVDASGSKAWNRIGDGGISTDGFCRYLGEGISWDWWDHVSTRLNNGQIIRVRPKR